ncbi:MAG: ASPIC/UnbV domain-containing protein [Thermoanaerobaculia bacterium]|nr:ASPIC/UnbV domain-containing protein [Thermoanaerobaculia bacterium]
MEFAAARAAGGTAPALAFADVGAPLGVGQIALQMVGWGTEFADLDGDGWLDLLVANGSTRETGEPKRLEPQPAMLLWSQRGEYFHDLAPLDAALAEPRVSRGLAVADPDGDGDLDVALYRLDGGLTLLANEMQTGNWLALRLRSRGRTPDGPLGFAEGSTATARVGGVGLRRTVGGASYLSQSGHTLHFGLGDATVVDEVEVRWLGGETQSFGPLEANTLWELIEGDREPRRRSGRAKAEPLDERARVVAFWKEQRAGMDAMKIDGDIPRAVEHFRAALSLDPAHQDSRYYLANCLATLGDTDGALAELQRLLEEDPGSHRGQKQWGVLRALTARSDEHLAAAQAALERAVEINREETGSLLALAEVELLRGDRATARQRLEWATSTNPRAVGGFFLLGYLAWSEGRRAESVEYLANAHAARGPEWKPEGSVAEGDVAVRMHHEMSPLSRFWERWEGDASDPDRIFAELAARLAG